MLAAQLKKNLDGSIDRLVPVWDTHAPYTPVSPSQTW
jgi:hypothetical protein